MTDLEYGFIKIKLKELLKDRGLSRNKLSHRAEMQKSQINAYYNILLLDWTLRYLPDCVLH